MVRGRGGRSGNQERGAAAKKAKKAPKRDAPAESKGITQARRAYTNARKSKLAELRALKSKRVKEFNAKTKKLGKADRTKQRRAFKAKVEKQMKELMSKFPVARGLKNTAAVRDLIAQIQAISVAK